MGETLLIAAVSIVSSAFASSGLWAFLQTRDSRKGASAQLLLGLAHTRIVSLGTKFVERGYITNYEYDDFMKYLCHPYSKFGGNGLADRVIAEVKQLPIRNKGFVLSEEVRITDRKVKER